MTSIAFHLPPAARTGLRKAAHNINSNATSRGADGKIHGECLASWLLQPEQQVCAYCHSPAEHTDHIVPLSKGGKHTLANLQRLCSSCNMMKSNLTESEFFGKIEKLLAKRARGFLWRCLLKVLPVQTAADSELHRRIASDTNIPLDRICPASAEKLALGHYRAVVLENSMLKARINRISNQEVYSLCTP